jgi:hypothetical protein
MFIFHSSRVRTYNAHHSPRLMRRCQPDSTHFACVCVHVCACVCVHVCACVCVCVCVSQRHHRHHQVPKSAFIKRIKKCARARARERERERERERPSLQAPCPWPTVQYSTHLHSTHLFLEHSLPCQPHPRPGCVYLPQVPSLSSPPHAFPRSRCGLMLGRAEGERLSVSLLLPRRSKI